MSTIRLPRLKRPLPSSRLPLRKWVKRHCGELLNWGVHRQVYVYRYDPRFVVKIEPDPSWGNFANASEWRNWVDNQDDQILGPFLCPIHSISETGQIMLMVRAKFPPHDTYPPRVHSAFTDLKYANYGFIGKRFVCVDYAYLLPIRGNRFKRAKWWDTGKG